MYLTKFFLDPQTKQGSRAIRNPQFLHANIAKFTSCTIPIGDADKINGRTLWRLDGTYSAVPIVWIVSPTEPTLDDLVKEMGKKVDGIVYKTRSYQPFLDGLKAGQIYSFRLAANPVHSGRSVYEPNQTKRYGHVTASQQQLWLQQYCQRHGFPLRLRDGEPKVAIIGRGRRSFPRQGKNVAITVAEYIGELEVCDPASLRNALTNGIGHAKAYGCGLMTLAPPQSS
jgi:CRISPR system Cascade subunit CasE